MMPRLDNGPNASLTVPQSLTGREETNHSKCLGNLCQPRDEEEERRQATYPPDDRQCGRKGCERVPTAVSGMPPTDRREWEKGEESRLRVRWEQWLGGQGRSPTAKREQRKEGRVWAHL